MVFQNDILAGASGAAGYTIDQSIRFNDDDSAKLTRTPASAGNRKTWTWSGWVKRGNLGAKIMFGTGTLSGTANDMVLWFNASDQIAFYRNSSYILITDPVYRDPSAWYHVVLHIDTTNATATDRQRLWVNGEEVTDFNQDNNLGLNTDYPINNTIQHAIGQTGTYGSNYYDGYMAEINFIDGQALNPTSFGEYDSVTGVWIPKAYSGSYGTNGFYITGENSASLGTDYSGNGNNFTSSGLTTADQVTDTPTDNYPVISPIDRQSGASAPLSDGNLKFTNNNTGTAVDARATFAVSSGKWYWEVEADALGQSGVAREFVGVVSPVWKIDSGTGGQSFYMDSTGYAYMTTGLKGNNNTTAAYGTAWTAGDIIGVALDLDNGKIWWSRNGTFQNSGNPAAGTGEAYSGLSGTYAPAFAVDYGTGPSRLIANFGQTGGLTYTPPTGFSALSTANLPEPTIKDGSAYFQTSLWSGNSSTQEINQTGNSTFQPDLVWFKSRSTTYNNQLQDAVRGVGNALFSNLTNAESSYPSTITSLDADGFTLGSDAGANQSGQTYVGWQWLAGNGTSQNANGSITSTVSVNTTAGFSIVSYTGNGSSGATVGHGLGVTPKTVIVKPRSSADHWLVSNWESGVTAFTEKLKLNANEAASSSSTQVNGGSSTTFTLGTDPNVNGNGTTYIAYCWNEVDGFSKFGTYTGNGSTDGPFVWCGFRPAFVVLKASSTAGYDWQMWDAERSPSNVVDDLLRANATTAEAIAANLDFTSNGFKLRTSASGSNGSGITYIFMAFAENPFKYSLAR